MPEASGRTRANSVSVSVVTGFLGSGKTTLLNRLVRHPGMADTALIVNEFGEIGIDHELVDSAFENTVLMKSGCVCCTMRGDLIDTIGDLFANVEQGNIPAFSRILVETTGLADPVPIVHALQTPDGLPARCRLGTVVTTLDAQQGKAQLAAHEEVARQIAVADVVLVTKTDLAGASALADLGADVQSLNPGVTVLAAVKGDIDPGELFRHSGNGVDAARLLHDHDHSHDGHAHHGGIASCVVTADRPLAYERLAHFLETLMSLRGNALLRIKGIVDVEGCDSPLVIQGVGAAFSRPSMLQAWPPGPRRSRLVFIYDGLDGWAIEKSFAALVLDERLIQHSD